MQGYVSTVVLMDAGNITDAMFPMISCSARTMLGTALRCPGDTWTIITTSWSISRDHTVAVIRFRILRMSGYPSAITLALPLVS